MAKSKTKEIKFTEEEQTQVNTFNQKINDSYLRLGQLRVRAENLERQIKEGESQLLNELGSISKEREDYFKTLYDKYGDGNYDPITGIFTPQEKSE